MVFSLERRKQDIQAMKEDTLDLLIIGGGITGAGAALQAAASGLKTALVEMQDFAEGTSSRSTKLVHGGIRYLKNFDVEVVADTVSERATVQRIAPHIPKPSPMLLPIYDEPNSTFTMFSLKVAMDLYDQLADVTGTKYANYVLSKEQVLEREPALQEEGLLGAGVYLDYVNNDSRLVIENIKRAAADGGYMVSRMKVVDLLQDENGRVYGAKVEDQLTGETFDIRARVVLNATGPWSDTIRKMAEEETFTPQMRPTKGVHLVVSSEKLSVPQTTYFDTGRQDGRMVFVIPREGKTYFGTTDTDYTGDLEHPTVTKEDVEYLLEVVNGRYPEAGITVDDIEASWAGLRPLLSSNPSDYNGGTKNALSDESVNEVISVVESYLDNKASRDDVSNVLLNLESEAADGGENPSAVSRGSSLTRSEDGLLTLAGGKITDYRKMAEGAMKEILAILKEEHGLTYEVIDSKTYPVSGGDIDPANVEEETERLAQIGIDKGLDEESARYIAGFYGSNAPKVFELVDEVDEEGELDTVDAIRLRYALEEEMTLTPTDFFLRRTNLLLFNRHRLDELKTAVINEMARYYGWTENETQQHTDELDRVIAESDLTELKQTING
ncbi:type 1 glycerol-3-phosphate oxidase [Atopococcus tabaci]|uniref:type 1 glycerol-3-phosphate oxidase n=1 Tax=Atopococcus tabaci TaxID=269774 RepID=UPI002409039A|nr:type 1 glycerol-3-phosphate oxidase [Atopococcus tabaci]